MLATRASKPAMFKETMRRVRLEKLSVNRNCPARLSHPSGRCQPLSRGLAASAISGARDGEPSPAFNPGSGCVRSSNGPHLLHQIATGSIAIDVTEHDVTEHDLTASASRLRRGTTGPDHAPNSRASYPRRAAASACKPRMGPWQIRLP